jgi:hypothetical protein
LVEAKGLADAEILQSPGESESARFRAVGARDAAESVAESEVAVRFEMVEKTGQALGTGPRLSSAQRHRLSKGCWSLPWQRPPALIPPKTNDAATRWTTGESWLIHEF